MPNISKHPEYEQVKALLTKSLHVDSIVKKWTVDQVDSYLEGLSRNVLLVPSRKALRKKCQPEHQTFHDGVPATVIAAGAESLILKRDMCDEMERYMSFFHKNWPGDAPVSLSKLAKAGFFSIGVNDTVQCFSCMGRINNWDHGDTAMGEHKRLYPKCKFVKGTDQRNVPYSGLVDESQKGTDIKLRPKSGALSSSRNETSGSEDDIVRAIKPLSLQELKPGKTVDGFKREINRLLSFRSWPITSPVDCYDLAAAGFYCVKDTAVQCFDCFGGISEWRLGDRPRDEHKRLFPACPFILRHWTENVPLSAAEKYQAIKHFAQTTAQETQPHQISPNVYDFQKLYDRRYGHTTHCLQLVISSQPTDLTVRYPEYPHKAYEQWRLKTFFEWPHSHYQIPANISKAVFFKTGNDEVKCAYYGGELQKWEVGDDPWVEQARWLTCYEWLLSQRGPGFVDNVRRKFSQSYFEPTVGIQAIQSSIRQPAPPLEDVGYRKDGAHNLSSSVALEPVAKPIEGPREHLLEEKQTNKSKSSEERKPSRQTSYSQSKHWLSALLLLLLLLQPLSVFSFPAIEVCPGNQTTELGRQGSIICHFPDEYNEVHWYDNISDGSYPVITFKPNEGDKYGQGLDSGTYDIHEDGSLIITNVSTWYERSYKAIVYLESSLTAAIYVISLKVTASPVDDLPVIPCLSCHQEYYYIAMQGENPSCSSYAARPPVQLEWFKKIGNGYEHLEMQQFNTTENSNGTFNSFATVHILNDSTGLIQLLVCRATWPLSDWGREREVFVDFRSDITFSDVTPKVQHMEINRYAIIQCEQSASVYVIWKRILLNSEPEIIGFQSPVMTKTVSDIPDVEVSAEGSLVFASPSVPHQGMYVCISGDGRKEEIQMTSLEILIPPSPPYIKITGCDDNSYRCVIRENSTEKLTCAVYGARPNVTLEWIAEDEDEISFFNRNEDFKGRGETSDTILSVEYKVSQDILCGEEILIKCHLYGPLSNIMKAESTALVAPASCKENEVKEGHGHGGIVILVVVCALIIIVILCVISCKLCHQTKSTPTSNSGGSRVAIQDASLQTETEKVGMLKNGTVLDKEVSV